MQRQPARRTMQLLVVLAAVLAGWLSAAPTAASDTFDFSPRYPRPAVPRSGLTVAGSDVQALQADEWANPVQAWLRQGERLWSQSWGAAPSCAQCHGSVQTGLTGVAAHQPAWSETLGRVANLEDRIRHCQATHQRRAPDAFESEALLSLSAWVTSASRGLPMSQVFLPAERESLMRGEQLYHQRQGLLNLACAHCHQERVGQRLFNDPLSQGQPNAYPLYRLEWQTMGSLERRLRSCLNGVKAELDPWGSPRMRDLALYLRWRAQGLTVELPAVRK